MRKIYYILLFSWCFLGTLCTKPEVCEEAKFYGFSEQDLEWQIYAVGQQYRYKNLSTGEIRTYTVSKVEKSILEMNDGTITRQSRCYKNPRKIEVIKVQMLNDRLEQITLEFKAAQLHAPSQNSASLMLNIPEHLLAMGLQTGYINQSESTFLDNNYIKPPASTIYLREYILAGKVYNNVYKDQQDFYYTKLYGLIEFQINNEKLQLIN